MKLNLTRFGKITALFVFLSLVVFSRLQLERRYQPGFPSFNNLVLMGDQLGVQDLSFIVAGFRSVAADMAYIQLLQYVGGLDLFETQGKDKSFSLLKPLTLRVTRIDPYFVRAYTFGAVILAWVRVVNRPAEAVDVLKEGIRYNPTYWLFQSYLIGIAFKETDQVEKMLEALGTTIHHPDCPPLVKAILANTFKANKKYDEAIATWNDLLINSQDESYRSRALNQIAEIKRLAAQSLGPLPRK